ncbi:hypothetical protein ACP6PL_05060 [Dapis sp. BLCC M126]|uniref:hypothetical protein n=1 Tax=Dapis sp. BLCC M126 TaxID=3400189 RepID=UPI003CEF3B30
MVNLTRRDRNKKQIGVDELSRNALSQRPDVQAALSRSKKKKGKDDTEENVDQSRARRRKDRPGGNPINGLSQSDRQSSATVIQQGNELSNNNFDANLTQEQIKNALQEEAQKHTADELTEALWHASFHQEDIDAFEDVGFGYEHFKEWVQQKGYDSRDTSGANLQYPALAPIKVQGDTTQAIQLNGDLQHLLDATKRPVAMTTKDGQSYSLSTRKIAANYRPYVWDRTTGVNNQDEQAVNSNNPVNTDNLVFSRNGQKMLSSYIDHFDLPNNLPKWALKRYRRYRNQQFLTHPDQIDPKATLQYSGHFAPTHGGHEKVFFSTFANSNNKEAQIEIRRNRLKHHYDRYVSLVLWDLYLQQRGFTRQVNRFNDRIEFQYDGQLNGKEKTVRLLLEDMNSKPINKAMTSLVGFDVVLDKDELTAVMGEIKSGFLKNGGRAELQGEAHKYPAIYVAPRDAKYKATNISDDETNPAWLPVGLQKQLGEAKATELVEYIATLQEEGNEDGDLKFSSVTGERNQKALIDEANKVTTEMSQLMQGQFPNYQPISWDDFPPPGQNNDEIKTTKVVKGKSKQRKPVRPKDNKPPTPSIVNDFKAEIDKLLVKYDFADDVEEQDGFKEDMRQLVDSDQFRGNINTLKRYANDLGLDTINDYLQTPSVVNDFKAKIDDLLAEYNFADDVEEQDGFKEKMRQLVDSDEFKDQIDVLKQYANDLGLDTINDYFQDSVKSPVVNDLNNNANDSVPDNRASIGHPTVVERWYQENLEVGVEGIGLASLKKLALDADRRRKGQERKNINQELVIFNAQGDNELVLNYIAANEWITKYIETDAFEYLVRAQESLAAKDSV